LSGLREKGTHQNLKQGEEKCTKLKHQRRECERKRKFLVFKPPKPLADKTNTHPINR
jgi:hypothetical protein